MNASLYDKTLQILKESFTQHQSFIEAKEQSERALLILLQENPSTENEIRLAILHFYDQCGLGCFVHYDKNQLHIIVRIKNKEHNIYVQKICNFLKEHKSVLYEKEPSKADFDEIFSFIDSTLKIQNQGTKRDLIKSALRIVFGIQPRDALFFKDGNVTLKKFDYEIVQINQEIRDISDKSHLNNLSSENRKMIDKALSGTNIQSLIVQNTLQILQHDIHLTHIDNIHFNQQFSFFAIQKLRIFLESLPLKQIDSVSKTIYCMALVQKHMWVMFEVVAKELLELCARDNANAIAFIGFYNGGSIALGGRTYTKPLITDKNGNPWTLHQVQETLHHKISVEYDIQHTQEQIHSLEERIHSIANSIAQDKLTLKINTSKVDLCNENLESKNKKLRLLVDERVSKDEINTLSTEINAIILEKSRALTTIEETQKHITTLEEEHINLLSLQEKLQGQVSYALKNNKEQFLQYDLLLRALADAIANGKELM